MPLKLLLSPLNQNENHPDLPAAAQVARTLSFVRNLPLSVGPAEWQTTGGPDCVHFIVPTNLVGPPAPVTAPVPAAVIGAGGRTLLPTNEPFEGRPLSPHVPLKLCPFAET